MKKMVVLIRRRPDMELEEFRRYWRETHAPIAAKIPGLRKYVQNHVIETPDGTPASFDGVAELWFDDETSIEQVMASPEIQAAVADNENFLDVTRIEVLIVDEVTIT